MKIVYIAGPYGAPTYAEIDQHIRNARAWAVKCVNSGVAVFVPHNNTSHFEVDAHQGEDFYKRMDMEFLLRCDALFLIPGWQRSSGAEAERVTAVDLGLPIFEEHEYDMMLEWYHKPREYYNA